MTDLLHVYDSAGRAKITLNVAGLKPVAGFENSIHYSNHCLRCDCEV